MSREVPISKTKETCFVCGEKVRFLLAEGACLFREARCECCGAGKRHSDLARVILETCLGPDRICLVEDVEDLAELAIYSTSAIGRVHEELASLPKYVASEYMDDVPLGAVRDGVRCEDLTRLRLPADSFDLVVSEEVLEHVGDLSVALLEVRRVLKSGGRFIFTVPVNESHPTRLRAARDRTGRIVHRLPPVHHGDPVRPGGSLVFTEFGNDLVDILARLGMPAEDRCVTRWHDPDAVSWIDEAQYDAYRRHCEQGTLFEAFRYNSHVFVARNDKLAFTGERFVPDSTAPVLAEYEHVHRYAAALDLADGKRVLDIACGEGFGSAILAARAERVIGVDISDDAVRHARTRYAHLDHVEFRTGACESIPAENDSIDLVVSTETIEHIAGQEAFLAEVKRVLRAGGVFLVSTPNPHCPQDPGAEANPYHVHELPLDEFRRMLEGAFAHVTVLGQRAVPASFITPVTSETMPTCRFLVGDAQGVHAGEAPEFIPKFFIAVCSDAPVAVGRDVPSALVSPRHEEVLDTYASPIERDHLIRQAEGARQLAACAEEAVRYAKSLEAQRDELLRRRARRHFLEHQPPPTPTVPDAAPVAPAPAVRRRAVCTICSKNYLHFARTLMQSLREVHPDWEPYLLLCDEPDDTFDPAAEPFTVIELRQLPIPDPRAFCFRYTILELNTAVKPWLLEWLFVEKLYDRVVYLDPDIFVYEPLTEVDRLLDDEHFMVLTPHLTGRLDDDAKPSELEILRAGSYNLGFLALRRDPRLLPFLEWWQEKVEYDCVVDFEHGLFVDQKWMELVPGMFGGVAVLRHEGCNVAYWNLKHRQVTRRHRSFFVNGQPLVFFHFSGLNPENPRPFSKHQDRFRLGNLGVARKLVKSYIARVKQNGLAVCKTWRYAFGYFTDGTPILDFMRFYYRQHLEPDGEVQGDPFALGHDYFHKSWGNVPAGSPLVTLLMRAIWEYREDLQNHFPDIEAASRWDYAYWFSEVLAEELEVPDCCVEVVRASLARSRSATAGQPPEEASAKGLSRAAPPLPPAPPRLSALRRFARRAVPQRLKRWIKQAVLPDTGSSPRQRRFAARLARFFPERMRRRLQAAVTSHPVTKPPPRIHVESPTKSASGTYYIGFFDEPQSMTGDGLVWMATSASVRILKPRPGKLRVSGQHIPEYFVRSGGSPETLIHLAVDGVYVGALRLVQHGLFSEEIDLPPLGSSRTATLTLEPSQFFVPAAIGIGEDQRKLTVRVGRIALEDTVLLDFSQCPTPFMPGLDIRHEEPGVNIVGYLTSELGIGESARLCTASAEAVGINYSLVNFEVGCSSPRGDLTLSDRISNENPHLVNLFHINADQMPTAYSCLGYDFFRNRYNIGFWHWELPEFPDEWTPSFGYLQEIWTPSQFVMNAVSAKSPIPVVCMAHAIGFSVSDGLTRQHMKLPDGKFLFLMMYDMHSFQSRKNPRAGLEAFRKAFPNPSDVAIVLKTMNIRTYPEEWETFRRELADDPGVVLISETLSRQQVYDLESLCDCFVSPHRSEGFGLGLAESMYLGKPVIGTYWSGNVDFMNPRNACCADYTLIEVDRDYGPYRKGQLWADVDVDHVAWFMKKLVEDAAYRDRIARAGQDTIRTRFSREAVGKLYRKRLEVLAKLM